MNRKSIFCTLLLVLGWTCGSLSQAIDSGRSRPISGHWSAEDTSIAARLRHEGSKYETAHAVLWVEKGGLSRVELQEFGGLVNQGIINIERFLGVALDQKRFQATKIEYFISGENRISHTAENGAPAVFLRLDRVKEREAPYLHETTHVLTSGPSRPEWLEEGFASYVETVVSARFGGYNSYLFNWERKDPIAFAREELATDAGKQVLPLVGLNTPWRGQSEDEREIGRAIDRDRDVMARAYYTLSESFVRFLADRIGVKKLAKMVMTTDIGTALRTQTGKTTSDWKAAWLDSMAR